MSPGATELDPAAGHADEGFLSPTGGFLPDPPPLAALPPDWAAWDTLANALPARVAAGEVAAAVAALPPFRADALPAACRCRAASLLGILVHALAREQQLFGRPSGELPGALLAPWDEVCAALGRPGAGMTYSDLFLYNWRLRDPAGPCRLANLDVLIPVFGTREERVFNLVMVETHAVAAPLVGLVERMATARATGDHAALAAALAEAAAMLRRMTFDTLLQIDPNPFAREPVDHLVWAKTVAPFAAPVRSGELGLSGGGSPVFHALDGLFGRQRFDSQIGRELVALRAWLPAAVRDFIALCSSLELPTHVAAVGERALTGAFRDAFDAYAGERGWLGIHRLKVYGFMEVGFRAGRTATNGGFAGEATARAWEALDVTLAAAQHERHPAPAASCPFAAAARLRPAGSEPVALAPIVRVRLDATGEGLAPRPGDRLGVWPRHQPALVARTLDALGARGHEPLRLTEEWRAALAARGEAVVDPLPLADFCRLARLRPLTRAIAKALLALHPTPALAALVERREEDHHELWEALALLAAAHYDPKRLWRAAPWQAESLARIVPPEPMRIYSLSSTAPTDGSAVDGHADASRDRRPEPRSEVHLDLTVGALRYASASALDGEPIERRGAASHDLPATRSGPIAARLVRPSRFRLPDDPSQPVVMFAGGTGIAPFRAFWQARRGATGATWLLAGVRDLDALAYRQELAAEVATHGLELRVVCSRTDVGLRGSGGVLAQVAAARGHVDRAITADAEALRALLRPREAGGGEAVVYVCGQTRFAHTVLAGLRHLLASPGSAVGDPLAALYGSGRLMLDVFTTAAAADAPSVRPFRLYDASEVIEHNRPDGDLWMVIDGLVYDVSELVGMHPGGADLLHANCGLDATRSWQAVRHHLEPEVAAMLDLYKIGKIRRLALGPRWGTTIIPRRTGTRPATATALAEGLVHLTLHDLYRAWIRYLYAVVELENTLAINAGLGARRVVATGAGDRPPLVAALLLDVYRLWLDTYLPHLVGEGLLRLGYLTVGLAAPDRPLGELANALAPVLTSFRERAARELAACQKRLARRPADPRLVDHLEGELAAARRWLAGYKRHLRRGLLAFEAHQAQVLERDGDELVAVLAAVPDQLRLLVVLTEVAEGRA